MKKSIMIVMLVLSISCLLIAMTEKFVVSIPDLSMEEIQHLISQGYDIAYVNPQKEIHLVVTQQQYDKLVQQYQILEIVTTEKELKNNLKSSYELNGRIINGYHFYSEIVEILHQYEENYPDICQVIELGPTQGKIYFDSGNDNYEQFNHTVYALKVSANINDIVDKPAYYFFGGHHAREPLSAEVCLTIMEDLITSYTNIDDEEQLINQAQIWFVPVVNPDGHEVVLSEMDIWHRKTIFDNNNNGELDLSPGSYGYNIDGIDLNRNYEYMWGTSGVSFSYNHPTYPGTHPFSAVETQYIKNLFDQISFVAGISYHTYGNYILYPLGYAYGKTSYNQATIASLAEEMAALTYTNASYTQTYNPMPAWELYPCSGTSEDYYYFSNAALAYTFELATTFIPDAQQVQVVCQNNLPAARLILSRHQSRFLTGLVTSAETGEPVKAEIFVYPNDLNNQERASIYSNEEFGRYHYALLPGQYQLKVVSDSYQTFITDFEIYDEQPTIINVELENVQYINLNLNLAMAGNANQSRNFANCILFVQHSRIDTLFTDNLGQVHLENITPGEILLTAVTNDLNTFTSSIELLPENNNQNVTVYFNDYDIQDWFDDLSLWNAINWTISNNEQYIGSSSACLSNYSHINSLTTINPLFSNPNENVYISFMANFGSTLQVNNYIEFYVSDDLINWDSIAQIHQTDVLNINNGWQHYDFIIPGNIYPQLYFRFKLVRNPSNEAMLSNFYLDLFCVSIGDVQVTEQNLTVQPQDKINVSVYPNPFNPETTIEFSLTKKSVVVLNIYNVKGQLVNTLINDELVKGKHKIVWNGTNKNSNPLASGMYFYKLQSKDNQVYGKLILLK